MSSVSPQESHHPVGLAGMRLPRPRLLSKLQRSLGFPLTLVCAPAGAGKSTLLSDFAGNAAVPTLAIRLDRASRDRAFLAKQLYEQLEPYLEAPGFASHGPRDWDLLSEAPSLAHALDLATQSCGGHLVLILDDYHKVDSSEGIQQMMSGLLELMPAGAHLVLSSRSVPPFPLARLRMEGRLLEVSWEDFVLNREEVSALLAEWTGIRLSPEEEELVLDKTGGWIAGVSLLTQSLLSQGKGEMISFLRDFGGSTSLVYDYFAEEVFRQQTPAMQHFLVATSLLGELRQELVNPFLGIDNAQDQLESLAAGNVFVICLDQQRVWYRYHPLFRGFLRARANRFLGPSGMKELNRRAADVYATQRDWSRAIDHLCAASCFDEAADLVERESEAYLERGYLETVRNWLKALPEQLRQVRPSLLMTDGMVSMREGHYPESMRSLTRAQTFFAEAGDTRNLATVASWRAMAAYKMRDYRQAVDLLEFTLASVSDSERRALTLARLCTYNRELGELERATQYGESALRTLAAVTDGGSTVTDSTNRSRPGLSTRAMRYLSDVYALRGDMDRSLELMLKAADLAVREQLGPLEQGYVKTALGTIRAVRGEGELALQILEEAEGWGSIYVEPQRNRINRWKGNVLTDVGDFAGAENCYQIAGFPVAERAWLQLRQHQPKRALLLSQEALQDGTVRSELLIQGQLLTLYGLSLAATGQEAKAFKPLQEAEGIFETHGYLHHLASLRLHIARLLLATNRASSAVRVLRSVLATSESKGFFHFYWWDPQCMALLLGSVDEPAVRGFAERLVDRHGSRYDLGALRALVSPAESGTQRQQSGAVEGRGELMQLLARLETSCKDVAARARIEKVVVNDYQAARCLLRLLENNSLSWRETEVFVAYYLDRRMGEDEGRTVHRREYADELCMTENTLKSHVRRIRRKLDLPEGADSLQVYRLMTEREASAAKRP